MSIEKTVEKMMASIKDVPAQADVIVLHQYSLDEIKSRAMRFLATTAKAYNQSFDHGDWIVQQNQTVIHMPLGAKAIIYHGSGTMNLVTGLNPMESLFNKIEDRRSLAKLIDLTAEKLNIRQWIGEKEQLRFERLWQIKAAAGDRNGKVVEPVLCRVVGTYRHIVNDLPVWGAASVAIKLAGEGTLDSITIQLRERTFEVLDRPKIVSPEQAVRQILLKLESLMGNFKISIDEIAEPEWTHFGYLSLPKRKVQRVLAPVYVSAIKINGQQESQAYLFAISATEKAYLPLCWSGSEAQPTPIRHIE